MSDYGVVKEGFRAKTLEVLEEEVQDEQRAAFGPEFQTQPDSVAGQQNAIILDKVAELWEVLQAVYRARQADSASGEPLDNVCAITGAIRIGAAPSKATLKLNLDTAVSVPIGKTVSIGVNGEQWEITENVTNTEGRPALVEAKVESLNLGEIVGNATTIDTIKTPVFGWSAKAVVETPDQAPFTLANGETLDVSVDTLADQVVLFETADFVDITQATAQEIVDVLNAQLNGASALAFSGLVRLSSDLDGSGSRIQITGGTALEGLGFELNEHRGFNYDDPARALSGQAEPYFIGAGDILSVRIDDGSIQSVIFGAAGSFSAVEMSKVINGQLSSALAYEVTGKTRIESLSTGKNAEIEILGGTANTAFGFEENTFSGVAGVADLGRTTQDDPELRVYREELLRISGSATVEAIRSKVRAVLDVTQAFVFENPTDVTDVNGLPPHSLEVVAQGGEDQAVGDTIFESKPIGIWTHRDPGPDGRTVSVVDSQGFSRDIHFTRPTGLRMYVEVDVLVQSGIFGGGNQLVGEEEVRNAVKEVGQEQQIGQDVIISHYLCAPLPVAGVLDVSAIRIDTITPPVNSSNIPLSTRELAEFASTDIVVNVTVA